AGAQIVQNQFLLTGSASWDVDLWGRIRRTIESDVASAQASAADLASARLSAQATLATNYYNLRSADELKHLLDDTVVAFTKSLQITKDRFASGTAARTDILQAQALLESTQSQAINVGVQRAQFEHAIAVLIGKAPSDFSIEPVRLTTELPVIPAGVPSTLLERRPDIAAAERQAAAANALVGVAIAAYYPDLTLSASGGFSSNMLSNLLQASNSIWSFGGQLSETVFDAGLRGAQVDQARAVYDQNVATYRQTVLSAFQQVEDELAAIRILAQQAEVQALAVRDAEIAVQLTLEQYKAGTVDYTAVITAQTNALSDEETAVGILQNRLDASVSLIQALGGGWDSGQLPDPDRLDASIGANANSTQTAATTQQ
ncbi:MAG TPA: efflux transporter outer membrane subunit, partial [Alphaproteobacteria bacterium]|nr:efflux transporter outer membrane subunit [Alphaproteobacteria bacterium]